MLAELLKQLVLAHCLLRAAKDHAEYRRQQPSSSLPLSFQDLCRVVLVVLPHINQGQNGIHFTQHVAAFITEFCAEPSGEKYHLIGPKRRACYAIYEYCLEDVLHTTAATVFPIP